MKKFNKVFKNFHFKFKLKYIIIILICFLSIGYAALNVNLFIEGHFSIGQDDEDIKIYLSFVAVNTDYAYTENLSTENLILANDQMSFRFSSSILDSDDNVIAYRIMNKSTQYDITNTHILCNTTPNYTFSDVSEGETIEAQNYLDSNVYVTVVNENVEEISCIFSYDLVERTEFADPADLDETPQIEYNAYEVGYEYEGIDEINSVGDALDYIYNYLN